MDCLVLEIVWGNIYLDFTINKNNLRQTYLILVNYFVSEFYINISILEVYSLMYLYALNLVMRVCNNSFNITLVDENIHLGLF